MIKQRCKECGGELRLKIDFFKQDGEDRLEKLKKSFKKKFSVNLPELKGYNCIECGACYDEKFEREELNVGWLGKR